MKYLKNIIISILILSTLTSFGIGMYYLHAVEEWSLLFVLLVGLLILNFVSSLIIFIQRRNLMSKLSWLLVINIFPFFGAMIFYIFGQRYSERKDYSDYVDNDFIKADDGKTSSKFLSSIANMTNRGTYNGDIDFFRNGNEAFKSLFADLRKAKKFIHLHYYIIKPGEIYEELRDILINKAKDGVEVKFIIDDFGRWGMPYHQINELKKHGIKIGVFGRVNFPFLGSENGYRTHRKMTIIDGKIVHTGGLNIANEYASLDKKYGMWLDFQGRITGSFVKSHSLLFMQDWESVTGQKMDYKKYIVNNKVGSSKATLIEDTPENKESIIEHAIVKMILNAKTKIDIATPYFVPSIPIYEAIKTALLSGVKVNLFIPGKPDKKAVYLATKYTAGKLSKFGLKVYTTNNMLLHTKLGLFDDKFGYFGTANLDVRSLFSNLEVINVVEGKALKQINSSFEYYKKISSIIQKDSFKEHFIREKLVRFFVNLFSPIM